MTNRSFLSFSEKLFLDSNSSTMSILDVLNSSRLPETGLVPFYPECHSRHSVFELQNLTLILSMIWGRFGCETHFLELLVCTKDKKSI